MQTAQRVAASLGYSDAHIRRLCITGKINAVKFGRQWMIDDEEVQRLRNMLRNGRGIAATQVAPIQERGDHGKTETAGDKHSPAVRPGGSDAGSAGSA